MPKFIFHLIHLLRAIIEFLRSFRPFPWLLIMSGQNGISWQTAFPNTFPFRLFVPIGHLTRSRSLYRGLGNNLKHWGPGSLTHACFIGPQWVNLHKQNQFFWQYKLVYVLRAAKEPSFPCIANRFCFMHFTSYPFTFNHCTSQW